MMQGHSLNVCTIKRHNFVEFVKSSIMKRRGVHSLSTSLSINVTLPHMLQFGAANSCIVTRFSCSGGYYQ